MQKKLGCLLYAICGIIKRGYFSATKVNFMKKSRIIYLPLMGRIGNQLFQYAFAYALQRELGSEVKILIDEYDVVNVNWTNSLRDYNLPNVEYVLGRDAELNKRIGTGRLAYKAYRKWIYTEDARELFKREMRCQKFLNKMGLIAFLRGYGDYRLNSNKSVFLYGYFQSENYFKKYSNDIKGLFDKSHELQECRYPYIEDLERRNSVCISVKIEHNAGSSIYDVCDEDYYRRAIGYIEENVDNPLYFLCSDNVDKAKELFFNDMNADIVCQPKGYSVALTLSAMSKCKHFVINNTSFGWWAQYLSESKDKMVIAPSRWKINDDPVSIYDNQDSWHLM